MSESTRDRSPSRDLRRDASRALGRLALVGLILAGLFVVSPFFINLPIFRERDTSAPGTVDGVACRYDAAPVTTTQTADLLLNQPKEVRIDVRNSGTCTWRPPVTMRVEGPVPAGLESVRTISVTEAVARDAFFTPQVAFAAAQVGTFQIAYRMRTPDGQMFGQTIRLMISVYEPGAVPPPAAPSAPVLSPLDLMVRAVLLVPALFGLLLAMYECGRFVRAFYGLKHDSHGARFMAHKLFGVPSGARATVRDNKLVAERAGETIEKIGGPGTLVVQMGMVALLERGGGFARIVGPGEWALRTFERVRAVVDVRRQNRTKHEESFTKDGIQVDVDTTIAFQLAAPQVGTPAPAPPARPASRWRRIFSRPRSQPPASPALPVSPDAVRAIVYETPVPQTWDKSVLTGITERISGTMLDDLWAPDDASLNPRRELADQLLSQARGSLGRRGIQVFDLHIGPFQVPDEVARLRQEWWQTHWKNVQRITEAEGDAQAFQLRETARVEAQTRMLKAITQGLEPLEPMSRRRLSEVIALRFIDAVESIADVWLSDEGREAFLKTVNELRRLSLPDGQTEEEEHGQ